MAFELDFETDNDAFAGEDLIGEVARILREIASKIEGGTYSGGVRDINGNRVGGFHLSTPDEDDDDGEEGDDY